MCARKDISANRRLAFAVSESAEQRNFDTVMRNISQSCEIIIVLYCLNERVFEILIVNKKNIFWKLFPLRGE